MNVEAGIERERKEGIALDAGGESNGVGAGHLGKTGIGG